MRCMNRNKVRFYYALYEGYEPIQDEWGNMTGEYAVKYGKPIECKANISPAAGETQIQQFGQAISYNKVMLMDNSAPPIDEYTALWVDRMPQLDANGDLVTDRWGEPLTPHDYEVKSVARSLNSVAFAIRRRI